MISRRRMAEALLVPAGVLVSHGLGYVLAHPEAAERHQALGHHGHLPLLTVIAVPAAVAALIAAAVAGRGRRQLRLGLPSLALAQAAAFIVLELGEHVASGGGLAGAMAEAGLWWGLGSQVIVAWAAMALVRASGAIGAALRSSSPASVTLGPPPPPAPTGRFGDRRPSASPASRRGPPLPALI
ncbi:MAG: hypothetical protein M3378_05435 [Actinomycetota bacterium]|nr:hypothetical protein [Actinomycetota bacterium]